MREHLQLGVLRRIADHRLEQEPVKLRLRERIGTLVLHRVLRRKDRKQRVERSRHAVGGHLPLAHRFEQRRLRLGWRPIDFVAKQDVGEDRPGLEFESARGIA